MAAKSMLNPFGDASQSSPFFHSISHKKGMHRIIRGLESSCGLLLLTGEIGVGKTSLSRHIQSHLADRYVFVELGNPYQTPLEQVFHCCEKLGIPSAGLSSIHDCVDSLERRFQELLAEGKRPVLIFEESHLLTKRHLGLIHILSNLRLQDGPLVQVIVVGQLEIFDLLGTEGMEALNQRIGIRCRLSPLTRSDAEKYIRFKLDAGGSQNISFSRKAVGRIWQQSGGVPRLINHICAHALDALAFKGTTEVSTGLVAEICSDSTYSGLFESPRKERNRRTRKRMWLSATGLAVAVSIAVAGWVMQESMIQRTAAAEVRFKVASVPNSGEQAELPAPVPGPPARDYYDSDEVILTVEEAETTVTEKTAVLIEPLEGEAHPVVGGLVLGAIAWNADPAKSLAVLNSKLARAGEVVDSVRLVDIGKDFVVLEFEGEFYKRSISR